MPDPETTEKAQEDLREGKSPSTAAGEFVREEIDHVREGKHGARSPQQAIAIGLSKARRAGIPLKPPAKESSSATPEVRKRAQRDFEKGQSGEGKRPSRRRSEATERALKKEPKATASPAALSKQTRTAAKKRSSSSRKSAAKKAARTRGKAGLRAAAKKASRTRSRKR